jgi:hypothetical protein
MAPCCSRFTKSFIVDSSEKLSLQASEARFNG